MAESEADRRGAVPAAEVGVDVPAPGQVPIPDRAPWRRLFFLAALGALLGTLPAGLAWWSTGEPRYLAKRDERLYRAWSRAAVLRGAWRLEDAVHKDSGPMMHPWPLFVPPGRLAYALGLDMNGAALLWRALAGAGVALGLYAAVRPTLGRAGLAVGVAAFLVRDAGLMRGEVAFRQAAALVAAVGHHGAPLSTPAVLFMNHLRVVTPGLAIPFLLAHYGLVLRARIGGGSGRAAWWAAASFGVLFYTYFYFFTVVPAGAVLAFLLDRGGRRLYATVLVAGTLLGAPGLVLSSLAKAATPSDWLLRTDQFAPIGHFAELLLPKGVILTLAVLGVVVLVRRRELIYLWGRAVAALAWSNHQVVTGLAIENFHWQQTEFLTCSLLTALVVVPWLAGRGGVRWRSAALGLALAAQVAPGFWMRGLEGTRSPFARELAEISGRVRRDSPALGLPGGGGRGRRHRLPVADRGGPAGRLPAVLPAGGVQLAGDGRGAG